MAASLDGEDGSTGKSAVSLDAAELGAPDCMLMGANWSIPAHRLAPSVVLRFLGYIVQMWLQSINSAQSVALLVYFLMVQNHTLAL